MPRAFRAQNTGHADRQACHAEDDQAQSSVERAPKTTFEPALALPDLGRWLMLREQGSNRLVWDKPVGPMPQGERLLVSEADVWPLSERRRVMTGTGRCRPAGFRWQIAIAAVGSDSFGSCRVKSWHPRRLCATPKRAVQSCPDIDLDLSRTDGSYSRSIEISCRFGPVLVR